MNESIVIGKEADAKKGFSHTHRNEEGTHGAQNEPERQFGSLRGVIGDIRSDGGTPTVESIATQMSGMRAGERAPALLALQKTHGNRYVQRVVSGIQAKLVVGQPGDKYEQEADRVADEVMRMPEPRLQRQAEEEEEEEELIQTKPLAEQITPLVQRQVEPEDEEEEEGAIQAKVNRRQAAEVGPDLESRIQALRGGGQPLPKSVRAFFEPRFGHGFSQVRVHTTSQAAETARELNARAFTRDRDVVFRAGEYAPETREGKKLLAHELVHVVQQSGVGSIFCQTKELEKPFLSPTTIQSDILNSKSSKKTVIQLQRSKSPRSAPTAAAGIAVALPVGAALWLGLAVDAAKIAVMVGKMVYIFATLPGHTYGEIYESTRGWKLKKVYKRLGAAAEEMGYMIGYVADLLWALEQMEQPDAADAAGLRAEMFDALYALRLKISETGKVLQDSANDFSAIRDQLDLSDQPHMDFHREVADDVIRRGSQSHSDLLKLYLHLSSMANWLAKQMQRLVDNHRAVFKQDAENWMARRR